MALLMRATIALPCAALAPGASPQVWVGSSRDANSTYAALADHSGILVSWLPMADNGAAISSVTVSCTLTGSSTSCDTDGPVSVTCGGSQCETSARVKVTSDAIGSAVRLQVVASNSVGNGQAASVTTIPACAPTAPSRVTTAVAAGGLSVNVQWGPPASDGGAPISSFKVIAEPGGHATVVPVQSGTVAGLYHGAVDGLAAGALYFVTVIATNQAGLSSTPSVPAEVLLPLPHKPGTRPSSVACACLHACSTAESHDR